MITLLILACGSYSVDRILKGYGGELSAMCIVPESRMEKMEGNSLDPADHIVPSAELCGHHILMGCWPMASILSGEVGFSGISGPGSQDVPIRDGGDTPEVTVPVPGTPLKLTVQWGRGGLSENDRPCLNLPSTYFLMYERGSGTSPDFLITWIKGD